MTICVQCFDGDRRILQAQFGMSHERSEVWARSRFLVKRDCCCRVGRELSNAAKMASYHPVGLK
jgi:hypothetical protein